MMRGSTRLIVRVLGAIGIVGVSAAFAAQGGRTPVPERPPMSEVFFKNVQILKGVPVDEFLASMGFISNALAVNCTYCHVGEGGGGWDEYAKDTDKKEMARKMMVMMSA